VQRYLNLCHESLWGFVTDGLRLRLLRDYHHTYTRGYVEFDLQAIFSGRDFAAFRALYRLGHASRFLPMAAMPTAASKKPGKGRPKPDVDEDEDVEDEPEEEATPAMMIPLESFYQHALSTGVKVGDDLRENVRAAIETLGNGFLQSTPGFLNRLTQPQAADARQPSAISSQEYYVDILHIIYRILFLLFAEQRGMFPGRGSLYMDEYSMTALRALAELPSGDDPHLDMWERLKTTFEMVERGVPNENIFGYDGALFAESKTPILSPIVLNSQFPFPTLRNVTLLKAIRSLTIVDRDNVSQRISYADLSVEELGSVYESLLDYTVRG
jgi:hypothetical protein